MRALRTESTGTTVALRAGFLFTLVVWVVAVLLLATSPVGLADEVPLGFIAYWIVAVFTMAALVNAVTRTVGATRIFWTVVGAGLLFRFVANTTIARIQIFDLVPPLFVPKDITYGISYALLFGAIIWLVMKAARNIALVATLDTVGVMFFTGLIFWHFALNSTVSGAGWDDVKSLLLTRSGPVFDVGLLCLVLVVACSDRDLARRAFPLAGAFGAFLVADSLYLGLGPVYQVNSWPELFWALGILMAGLAALVADDDTCPAAQLTVGPRVVAVAWFSPLSPAVQLALLLAWGAVSPPLPPYILWGGAIVALYLALRISLGAYASQNIQLEAEKLAKVSERDRVSEDLHDTLKQCVHSIPMMLAAYQKTREKDPDAAET
ncbi:MAG: histidine kinase, partial [Rubrobacteraceae bacterium]